MEASERHEGDHRPSGAGARHLSAVVMTTATALVHHREDERELPSGGRVVEQQASPAAEGLPRPLRRREAHPGPLSRPPTRDEGGVTRVESGGVPQCDRRAIPVYAAARGMY